MDLKIFYRNLATLIACIFYWPSYATSRSIFIEPNASYTPVISQINSAKQSINMAMYILTDYRIINALIKAQRRGVNVHIILEKNIYGGSKKPQRTKRKLTAAGIQVKWSDPNYFSLTHEKAFDVDGKTLTIMTLNQTYSAYHYNREYGVIDKDKKDNIAFEKIFNGDWHREYYKITPSQLIWSPNNASCQLLAFIESAKKSIQIESEELNDKMIENSLIQKAQDGIDVRIIMPPQKDKTSQKHVMKGGVQLRVLSNKNKQLYMHAKMIIVDGKQAFIGSENLSPYSLQMNRELGILVSTLDNINTLKRSFAFDWQSAN